MGRKVNHERRNRQELGYRTRNEIWTGASTGARKLRDTHEPTQRQMETIKDLREYLTAQGVEFETHKVASKDAAHRELGYLFRLRDKTRAAAKKREFLDFMTKQRENKEE